MRQSSAGSAAYWPRAASAIAIVVIGYGAGHARAHPRAGASTAVPDRASAAAISGQQLLLSGWFHVIWNGRPRYVLIDERGQWTRLLIDDEVARRYGGPLAFDRKRVRIVGEEVSASPATVRVSSIEPE